MSANELAKQVTEKALRNIGELPHTKEHVAITVFEAFYRDVSSDDYKCYGPGDADYFILKHKATGRLFEVLVKEMG